MPDLYRQSLAVIEAGQTPTGAFLGGPDYGRYRYSSLRDGCFVAYSADRVGRHDLSRQFLRWVNATLLPFEGRVSALVTKAASGDRVEQHEWLHCRYTPDGEEGMEAWGNFQLDGYGTYIWAVCEHGRLTKFAGGGSVDANLLWVSTPFRLLEPDDPIMTCTVAEIERRLAGGGVRRYPEDTYYGGGEWVLLAAWLGWYHSEVGNDRRVQELLAWIESKATAEGHLPEQVPENVNAPAMVAEWTARWGSNACPLLWSHAMYLVLRDERQRKSA